MVYLLTAIGLSPGGSSTVHIYTQTVHRTTQWNSIKNGKYIKIRIHKHNNKTIYFAKLNRSIRNLQPYIQWNKIQTKEYEKSNRFHVIFLSFNNDRQPVIKSFTPLHYTSLHLSTLHFFPFILHPNTIHYPLIMLNPI